MAADLHLHIVGIGLIGGSIATGLKSRPYRITGWDRNQARAREARDRGWIEECLTPGAMVEPPDGLLLAVPVPSMLSVVEDFLDHAVQPRFVTDVGSTKQWIFDRMEALLPPSIEFIGAHPMAGSEVSGLKGADPLLFENAICVITPGSRSRSHLSTVQTIWENLGAHILQMDPEQHDRVVAHVSHLPHLVAPALLHTVQRVPDYENLVLPLAAGGFRDTTRIAGADPALWRDIFETNEPHVRTVLEEFQDVIAEVSAFIENGQWRELTDWLNHAGEIRREIPEKTKGLLGELFELRIQAPDRPGVLSKITGTLAEASINIADIEVLRVREGDQGTIRLRFRERDELDEARKLLQSEGIEII